jgi:putative FmdB family regulatory protein
MPVYEYKCDFCASRLEVERSFDSEAGSPTCRDCGILMSRVWHSPQITKLISSRSWVLLHRPIKKGSERGSKRSLFFIAELKGIATTL